jgi:uncharacterized damage-inducible protein DinB
MFCQSLYRQYQAAFQLLAETVQSFTPDQWLQGEDFFQVPARIGFHVLDTLDYYFRPKPEKPYSWGHRFGSGWWELEPGDQPTLQDLLNYSRELQNRIRQVFLDDLTDDDLRLPFDKARQHGQTRLEHFIYALRHTMHHHGALSLLSLKFGNPEGHWE